MQLQYVVNQNALSKILYYYMDYWICLFHLNSVCRKRRAEITGCCLDRLNRRKVCCRSDSSKMGNSD